MQFFFKLVQKLQGHQNLLNYARVQYFSLVVRIVSFKRFSFFFSPAFYVPKKNNE